MSQGIIYSSEFRFYVERVRRAHAHRGQAGAQSEVELIETFLRQHGVTVVADLDKGTPGS